MKATRWIVFCLLAFGLGTGVAFAFHSPTIGIPKSSATDLASDLSKIQSYAEAGRCDAVRGRVNSAAATIDNLPVSTNQATQSKLSSALESIRSTALATCQQVADDKLQSQRPTTPETTPEATTPEATTPTVDDPIPATTPTPDDGSGPGATEPDSSSSGGTTTDGGTTDGGQGDQSGDGGGGITLPNGQTVPGVDAVRQKLRDAEKQIKKALKP